MDLNPLCAGSGREAGSPSRQPMSWASASTATVAARTRGRASCNETREALPERHNIHRMKMVPAMMPSLELRFRWRFPQISKIGNKKPPACAGGSFSFDRIQLTG